MQNYIKARAIKKTGLNKSTIIDVSITDITGPMLTKIGMGYTVGMGKLGQSSFHGKIYCKQKAER